MNKENLLQRLKEHKPIIVNYGKSKDGKDIKELAMWDEKIKRYRSETGIWDSRLLLDILYDKAGEYKLEYDDNIC